jgi:predicted transcriptional regulator
MAPINEKRAELLQDLGLTRPAARTLTTLLENKCVTQREIEVFADLRQPEVSLALGVIEEKAGIKLTTRQVNSEGGKGRPVAVYSLAESPMIALDKFVSDARKEFERKAAIAYKILDSLPDEPQ